MSNLTLDDFSFFDQMRLDLHAIQCSVSMLEKKIDELDQKDQQQRLEKVITETRLYENEITSLESQIAYLTKQLSQMQEEKDFYKSLVVDF